MNYAAGKIEPGLLAAFLAVADRKTVSGAADALHLSQPAVTAQIKRLEDGLGAPLFIRSVQGMRLTARGVRLYEYAREIARLTAEAESAVTGITHPSGQLRIAASTTIASYVLPASLAAFRRANQRIDLEIIVGNTEEVLRHVRDGACPLGLVEGLARAPQVSLKPMVEDELVLIRGESSRAPEIFRIAKSVRVALDVVGLPIIWREAGSGTRAVTERALRMAGVNARKLAHEIVIGSTEGIKAAVAAGLGVAFVSRWSIQEELAHGRLVIVPLADLTVARTFHWAVPTGALPATAVAFMRHLEVDPPTLR
ncbi:MAG TPA: LysR family transcriptional regulator [Candidatus Binataceae bacterium]|nr:LysR family transcriptional regulator [Candidatus Binataceae bacterium]